MKELISERSDLLNRLSKIEVRIIASFRKKLRRYSTEPVISRIGRKGSEGLPVKLKGIIDVWLRPVRSPMALRVP
jgi:hypothetical protein